MIQGRETKSPIGARVDAETVPTDPSGASRTDATLRALHVTGPGGGARHILPEGLVRIGRGAEATIMVDDPRVSKEHAGLMVAGDVTLSDIGSTNGTFLGNDRLTPGESRRLENGQSFFIGDSSLVIRPTSLRRSPAPIFLGIEDLLRHVQSQTRPSGESAPVFVLKVRPLRPVARTTLEGILGAFAESPADWMMWVARDQLILGMNSLDQAGAQSLERALRNELTTWDVMADVEGRFTPFDQLTAKEARGGLFGGEASLILSSGRIVIRDPAMEALRRTVERVAPAAVNVLILGETGAGKDIIACMVHELSPRASQPFVGINCASLPEPLMESELFGHERGAFTGAQSSRPGLLESADGGTVFLDEIGDLSSALQAKLLRVIESHEVRRVGGVRSRRIDLRFVAATNRDLAAAVASGGFREDLYYRINCITLTVPPLCDRPSEIEPLALLFLDRACVRFGLSPSRFSAAALATLNEHSWPGNVRELRNVVERAALMALAPTIEPEHLGLPLEDKQRPAGPSRNGVFAPPPVETRVPSAEGAPELERDRIEQALATHGGNQSRAAVELGIPRRTLVRRIARLGLPRPRRAPT